MQALEPCGYSKTTVYDLLKTGQVFTRYHEKNIRRIRFYVYGEKRKLIKVSWAMLQMVYIFTVQVM